MNYFNGFTFLFLSSCVFIYGFERFWDILNRNQGVKIVKRKEDIFYLRAHCLLLFNSPRTLALLGIKDVHGSSWVGLRGFFDLTHYGGSKKIQPNPTQLITYVQPNPIQPIWVRLNPWIGKFIIIIIIIIKLSKKNININILKKPKD